MNANPLSQPGRATAAPGPDTPVLDPSTITAHLRHRIPRYGDQVWAIMDVSANPSASRITVRWATFPATLREQFRHAAWVLANYPLPDEVVAASPTIRPRLSLTALCGTIYRWRLFARWLDDRAVTSLDQVTSDLLGEYQRYLVEVRNVGYGTTIQAMFALTRLFVFGQTHLPEDAQVAEPPWFGCSMKDYLPREGARTENETSPIHPDTMGPLLVWALRFVEDFATDILAAVDERDRLDTIAAQPCLRGRTAVVRAHLRQLAAQGRAVPSWNRGGATVAAMKYLAGNLNVSHKQVQYVVLTPQWRQYLRDHPGPCPLDTPVTGRLGGKPWTAFIDFNDVPALRRHLTIACFIVTGYLTGMRPAEVLALTTGCCPEPDNGDPAHSRRFEVFGRHFKDARDKDRNHVDAGLPRDTPWATVPQVAAAIRVLERMVDTELLFDAEVHDHPRSNRPPGRALNSSTVTQQIKDFVTWVNDRLAHGDQATERIPTDPNGAITPVRFRRTLAWHIARKPDGLVALAVQYGHLRTIVSEGYASRSRDGIHDLLDFETARTIAEHLADLGDDLAQGEGVSGPAARRLIEAAGRCAERFGGATVTKRQYRALLADPLLNVFENKSAYLTCNYDPSKALCREDRASRNAAPSLDRCQAGCANIARTDHHAAGLRAEADRLQTEAAAAITPELIADRLRARAAHLRDLADRHDTDRITTGQEHDQ